MTTMFSYAVTLRTLSCVSCILNWGILGCFYLQRLRIIGEIKRIIGLLKRIMGKTLENTPKRIE